MIVIYALVGWLKDHDDNMLTLALLGNGSKIILIIFAEFSVKGYPLPPLLEIINFSARF